MACRIRPKGLEIEKALASVLSEWEDRKFPELLIVSPKLLETT